MLSILLAASFTLSVSAFCSVLEAMILSTTTPEIESLRKKNPKKGSLLENFKTDIEGTSSAILGLNTIANTAGTALTSYLATKHFDGNTGAIMITTVGMIVGVLVISEIIPKNLGVIYRKDIQTHLVYPLQAVRFIMIPISLVSKYIIYGITGTKNTEEVGDEEIKLLAEKSAKEGTLTVDESNMISNALSLDNVKVADVMTPRTVVTAFEHSISIGQLFEDEGRNIPFARMPVYDDNIDNIVGLIRRRDLLKAKAEDKDSLTVKELMQEIIFIPENANGTHALQQFLKSHQQLAVVVDEFGSMSGVITVEDIMEHILGKEIFEKDDVAIDMRELARRKKLNEATSNKNRETEDPSLREGLAS